MALQASGSISLNDIHVEAGGTTATQCTINDADIRGIIGKSNFAQSSFSDFHGASAVGLTYQEYVRSSRFHESNGASQTVTLPSNNISQGDVLVAIIFDNAGVTSNGSDIATLSNPTGTGAKNWTTAGTYTDQWSSGNAVWYHYFNQARIQYAIAGSTTGNSFTMYGNWQSTYASNSTYDEGNKYCVIMRFEAAASDVSHYDYESEGRSVVDSDMFSYTGSTRTINGSNTPVNSTYSGIISVAFKGGQGTTPYDGSFSSTGDLQEIFPYPLSYATDERYTYYAKAQERPSSGSYSNITVNTGYGGSVAWNYSHCYLRVHT